MDEPGTSDRPNSPVASSSKAGPSRAPGDLENLDLSDPAVLASLTADELKKFIDTGRTGRRNALPDVSQPEAQTTSTAGVAEALGALNVQENHRTEGKT